MNGMTFGMEGPTISGWWVNPKTGDKFNAIDTYFEDNQLVIKTSDGRFLNYNRIQDYVQTKPEEIEQIVKAAKNNSAQKTNHNDIPIEVLNELETPKSSENIIIPDDNIFGAGGQKTTLSTTLGNINDSSMPEPPVPSELAIIQRALKNKTKPSVTGMIDWKEFPKKEIEMLIEMMDVPFDTIVDYYVNSVNMNEIVDNVKSDLRVYINCALNNKKITAKTQSPQNDDKVENQESKQTKKVVKKK